MWAPARETRAYGASQGREIHHHPTSPHAGVYVRAQHAAAGGPPRATELASSEQARLVRSGPSRELRGIAPGGREGARAVTTSCVFSHNSQPSLDAGHTPTSYLTWQSSEEENHGHPRRWSSLSTSDDDCRRRSPATPAAPPARLPVGLEKPYSLCDAVLAARCSSPTRSVAPSHRTRFGDARRASFAAALTATSYGLSCMRRI